MAWDTATHRYDRMHVRLQLVLDACVALTPRRVLELGCSTGVLRAALLARLPGLRYLGCDVSGSAVAAIGDPGVVRCDLNAEAVPFAGEKVDCVIGSGILEYLHDVPALLAQLRDRLDPGGHVVVSYFNFRHLHRRLQQWRHGAAYRHPAWRNEFDQRRLLALFGAAGFDQVSACPSSIGWGASPAVGHERWSAATMRRVRHLPGIGGLAHQFVRVFALRP